MAIELLAQTTPEQSLHAIWVVKTGANPWIVNATCAPYLLPWISHGTICKTPTSQPSGISSPTARLQQSATTTPSSLMALVRAVFAGSLPFQWAGKPALAGNVTLLSKQC